MLRELQEQAVVKWVSIADVLPNPLNPRADDTIREEEMQDIIKKRGWEEPLTVYEKGGIYVVLAGHRRLNAAKKVGEKRIPIFVVSSPRNAQEEVERIASLQSGRVDWTPYEWAKFTYERWLAWDRMPIVQFAKEINMGASTVRAYIHVMEYYPHHEIEHKLKNSIYNVGMLDALAYWIEKAKVPQKKVFNEMSEDLVRRVLLNKVERKLIDRESIRGDKFYQVASKEDFKEFLTSNTTKLDDVQQIYGIDARTISFPGHLSRIGQFTHKLDQVVPQSETEKAQALNKLIELRKELNKQINKIRNNKA